MAIPKEIEYRLPHWHFAINRRIDRWGRRALRFSRRRRCSFCRIFVEREDHIGIGESGRGQMIGRHVGSGKKLHGSRLISCPTAFRIWICGSQTHSVFEKSATGALVGWMSVQGSWRNCESQRILIKGPMATESERKMASQWYRG